MTAYDYLCSMPIGATIMWEGKLWTHLTVIRDDEAVHFYRTEGAYREDACPSLFALEPWYRVYLEGE